MLKPFVSLSVSTMQHHLWIPYERPYPSSLACSWGCRTGCQWYVQCSGYLLPTSIKRYTLYLIYIWNVVGIGAQPSYSLYCYRHRACKHPFHKLDIQYQSNLQPVDKEQKQRRYSHRQGIPIAKTEIELRRYHEFAFRAWVKQWRVKAIYVAKLQLRVSPPVNIQVSLAC